MSFGTQTFGSETYNSDGSIAVTAIEPSLVSRCGWETVVITGTFLSTEQYHVDIDGVRAFSGVVGSGSVISTDGSELSFVMPELPSSGTKTIQIQDLDGGSQTSTSISVSERSFNNLDYEIRQLFPAWYATGRSRLDLEPQET